MRIASFILLLFAIAAQAASPIPNNRTQGGAGWWPRVGIPGGIPNRTTIYATHNPGDSASAINASISACPSNQVVLLTAGTYNISQLTIGKSGVTVRGETNEWGQPAVIINTSGHGGFIGSCCAWYNAFSNPQSTNTKSWTAGYTQGSTVITLNNTNWLSVGMLVYLDQENDTNTTAYSPVNPAGPWVSGEYASIAYPSSGRDRIQFQINRVASINGNDVTLEEPLYMPNWASSQNPQLWFIPNGTAPVVTMSGFENIRFNADNGDTCGLMQYTAYCWFLNCWGSQGSTTHLGAWYMTQSLRPEVRRCYQTESAGAVDRYGIHTRVVSGALITDNILSGHGTLLMVNGVSGSVYSYNYAFTNVDQNTSGYATAGIITHGGTPNMVLFEGNVVPQVALDSQWQNSSYMCIFRNRTFGKYAAARTDSNLQAIGIFYTNRHASIVGNVLGRSGYDTHEVSGPSFGDCRDGDRVLYLGYEAGGNGCNGISDGYTISSIARGYNWSSGITTNGGIIYDGYTYSDVPASLYLESKPSNWGTNAWPPIDPTMGDFSETTPVIPAMYRMLVTYTNGGPGLDMATASECSPAGAIQSGRKAKAGRRAGFR